MKKLTATIIGFAAAPLVVAIPAALVTSVTNKFDLFTQFLLTLTFYNYALLFTVVLGVPAFLLLHHFRLVRWWVALVGGAVIGAVVLVIVHLPGTPNARDFVGTCPLGAASGFVFWLIWKCGRDPNKRDKKMPDAENNQGEAAKS